MFRPAQKVLGPFEMRFVPTAAVLIGAACVASLARSQPKATFPALPQQQVPSPSAAPPPPPAATNAPRPWAAPSGRYSFGSAAQPAERPPALWVRKERPRTLTLALGGAALGLPWATGLGIAGASGFPNGSGWLFAPVIGPWAALLKRSNPCDGLDQAKTFNSRVGQCVAEPIARAMLVFDGVLQATGALLLIVGSRPDTVLVKRAASNPRILAVAPSAIGNRGYGVRMLGSF